MLDKVVDKYNLFFLEYLIDIVIAKHHLIEERNKILDNSFKMLFYFIYKKEIKKIDYEIDDLDLQLYQIEKDISKEELNQLLDHIVEKYCAKQD